MHFLQKYLDLMIVIDKFYKITVRVPLLGESVIVSHFF